MRFLNSAFFHKLIPNWVYEEHNMLCGLEFCHIFTEKLGEQPKFMTAFHYIRWEN